MMMKYLFLLLLLFPLLSKAQAIPAKRYVNDRQNDNTYLDFSNGKICFRYMYDLIQDKATGQYRISKDTIFLTYDKDSLENNVQQALATKVRRPDSLIIVSHKLYQIINGVNQEFAKPLSFDHQGPKSWHFHHQYLLFGPYQSTQSGRYYMIDTAFAQWNKARKKKKSTK
jgi:hypothetical protein